MPPSDYVSLSNGIRTLYRALTSSGGIVDANQIIATNGRGELDPTFLPPFGFPYNLQMLSEDIVLASDAPSMQYLSPIGQSRSVTLPDVVTSVGRLIGFCNLGSFVLVVKDDTPNSIAVAPQQVLWVHSDGTLWREVI